MKYLVTGAWAAKYNDFALFFLRVVTGLVFMMHGWQKWQGGVEQTAGFVGMLGFPMPEVFAVLLIAAELVGGAAIILGVCTRLAAKFNIIVAIVALVMVHLDKGFFMSGGGYEFILTLLAALVAVLVLGPGRWSVDAKFLKM